MKTKTGSLIIGVVFLLIGILGFIPNPVVGMQDGTLFHADTTHSIIHIVSGLLFVLVGTVMTNVAPAFHMIFGIVYLLLGVLGLINAGDDGMASLLGFLHVNGPDNYLHIALGLIIFLTGMGGRKQAVTTP